MKGKQYASKLQWGTSQDTQKNTKYSPNYNTYNSNAQQTYTPKGGRDYNFFKSSNNPTTTSMQRCSSQEQFKLKHNKIKKSMIGQNPLNVNNQESSSKNDFQQKIKLKSYINSTSSTQTSNNFFNQSLNPKDSSSPRSPKNTRQEQLKIQHSPTFGSTSSRGKTQTFGQPKYTSNTGSNKNIAYKRPQQNSYSEAQKNTYAFLRTGNSKISQPYQAQGDLNLKRKSSSKIIINKKTGQQFKIIKKLGQGKFGKVFIVQQIKSGFILAMKKVEKKNVTDSNLLHQLIRQIKIQLFLQHPNIIKVYGFFNDIDNFYVLLELGSHGQLYDIIQSKKTLKQQSTSFIVKSLLEAVKYMHNFKILHRDIKPQNIVFIHGNVKICDFGWAVHKKDDGLRSTFCGTPLYLSPQILIGKQYDQKVDLWAIGILACELFLGCNPFNIQQKQDLKKIITDEVIYPKNLNKTITKQFKQFIDNILNKNPKERMTSSQLLKLPFIQKYEDLETCQELFQ